MLTLAKALASASFLSSTSIRRGDSCFEEEEEEKEELAALLLLLLEGASALSLPEPLPFPAAAAEAAAFSSAALDARSSMLSKASHAFLKMTFSSVAMQCA